MNIQRTVVVSSAVGLMIACIAVSFLLGDKAAVDRFSIKRVTASQAATAMQRDNFYSEYRESAVLLSGRVASTGGASSEPVIRLETGVRFTTSCQIKSPPVKLEIGEQVTFLAVANRAVRLPSGVLFPSCILVSP